MGLLGVIGSLAGNFFGGPVGGMIGGQLGSAIEGGDAASSASQAQQQAAQAGIDLQREMFNKTQGNLQPWMTAGQQAMGQLNPYAQAGAPALQGQQNLIGLNGAGAQQGAISAIANSPLLQQLMQQGEAGMLQNASATGGLRGGNLQGALAQFRPAMLQQAIDQQYSRLGGITALGQLTNQNMAQMGQSAAAGVGTSGMNAANQISNLYGQQGAAQAGGIFGQNAAMQNGITTAGALASRYGGFGNIFGMGGSGGGMQLGGINPSSGEFMGSLEF